MKTMKKILTLTLLALSVLGFSQTLEVENLKINENLITTGENLLPDRVITLDTINDKVTETNVTKVTSLSFQNLADSISKNNTFDSLNVTYSVDAKVINADSVDCEVFEADKVTILNSTSETTPASATGIGVENDNATANRVNSIGFGASSVFQSGMLNTWVDANTNNLSLYNWTGGAISRKLYLKDDTTFLGKDEAVTILPNKNVGIGIVVPTEKLHVNGNVLVEDSIKLNTLQLGTSNYSYISSNNYTTIFSRGTSITNGYDYSAEDGTNISTLGGGGLQIQDNTYDISYRANSIIFDLGADTDTMITFYQTDSIKLDSNVYITGNLTVDGDVNYSNIYIDTLQYNGSGENFDVVQKLGDSAVWAYSFDHDGDFRQLAGNGTGLATLSTVRGAEAGYSYMDFLLQSKNIRLTGDTIVLSNHAYTGGHVEIPGSCNITGNLTVDGTLDLGYDTLYHSIHPSGFCSNDDSKSFRINSGYSYEALTDASILYAPVNLPHGAKIIEAVVYGDDATEDWYLQAHSYTGVSTYAVAQADINTVDNTISATYEIVDNQNYNYFFTTTAFEVGDEIYSAVIRFVIQK